MLIITDGIDGKDTVVTVLPSPGCPDLVTVLIYDYATFAIEAELNVERTPQVLIDLDRDNLGALVELLQGALAGIPDVEKV